MTQTRFYQEVFSEGKIEGKLEAVPNMISAGISVESIAHILDLPIETVRQIAGQTNESNS